MGDLTTLALDLGSTFGWALGKNGVITHSGEVSLKKHIHPGHRFLEFRNYLFDFRGVNQLMFEEVPRFESKAAAMVYCGLLAELSIFSLVEKIGLASLQANTVKKVFTGNGNASKTLMCEHAHKIGWEGGKLGTDIHHNACDAVALLYVTYLKQGIEDPKISSLTKRFL